MTEKVLLEIKALNTENGKKYKIQRGKRTFILQERNKKDKCNKRHIKSFSSKRRNLRQALENLENLYDELYPIE